MTRGWYCPTKTSFLGKRRSAFLEITQIWERVQVGSLERAFILKSKQEGAPSLPLVPEAASPTPGRGERGKRGIGGERNQQDFRGSVSYSKGGEKNYGMSEVWSSWFNLFMRRRKVGGMIEHPPSLVKSSAWQGGVYITRDSNK